METPSFARSAVILPSRGLDVLGGWGITTLTCALVLVLILRTRDAEWDLPPAR